MTDTVDRAQLMAYRILASGLDRRGEPADVWDVGIQDRDGSAGIALAARTPPEAAGASAIGAPADSTPLALAWTLRGTPHVHPRAALPGIRDALWPGSETAARTMLAGSGTTLAAQHTSALDALAAVAAAMRDRVTSATTKADLSTALTAVLPSRYVARCVPCGVDHVPELLFRYAALPAGLGLVPGRKATLAPLGMDPTAPAATGHARLVEDLLALYGAATKAEIAAHLGIEASGLTWPDTVPLRVDDVRLQATPSGAAAVRSADRDQVRDIVRLLPPGDPLLQPRNRSLIVPDRTRWKALWPALGPAGAVLAGGEISGTWRPKTSGRSLTLTVVPFRRLTAAERRALESEADLVRRVRGQDGVTVRYAD